MRIGHYYASAFERPSGVTAALRGWSDALTAAGDEVVIFGASVDGAARPEYSPETEQRRVPHLAPGVRMRAIPRGLAGALRDVDLVVLHEGWVPSNLVAAAAAERAGVPYVVMPHGVYERAWAQLFRLRRTRAVIERRVLSRAAGVHLFFGSEKSELSEIAPKARCFVSPTGYDVPPDAWEGGTESLVWIGRYSVAHKGLDLLLSALASMPPYDRPHVVMRGVDYLNQRRSVETQVDDLGLRATVEVGGPVYGDEKSELLMGCAGYLHPSRWECHSIGLLEALALGVPTLVSRSMHIAADLEPVSAAVVAEPSPRSLADGVARLRTCPQVGVAGRAFVEREMAWARIVPEYRSIIGALARAS